MNDGLPFHLVFLNLSTYYFSIVDIAPPDIAATPDSVFIERTVNTPGYAKDIHIWDGFAYIAYTNSGLAIADVSPPSSAYYLDTFLTGGSAQGVSVYGSMVYVADGWGGLRILQSQ